MTKSDYFTLIVSHMVNQGIEDSDQFMEFVTFILPMMTIEDLAEQLATLEAVVA
mgnify:CR=1 FL=1